MNKDLTKGNVRTVLLSFIIPLLGSMLFQQLYNITDSLVAGKLIPDFRTWWPLKLNKNAKPEPEIRFSGFYFL